MLRTKDVESILKWLYEVSNILKKKRGSDFGDLKREDRLFIYENFDKSGLSKESYTTDYGLIETYSLEKDDTRVDITFVSATWDFNMFETYLYSLELSISNDDLCIQFTSGSGFGENDVSTVDEFIKSVRKITNS